MDGDPRGNTAGRAAKRLARDEDGGWHDDEDGLLLDDDRGGWSSGDDDDDEDDEEDDEDEERGSASSPFLTECRLSEAQKMAVTACATSMGWELVPAEPRWRGLRVSFGATTTCRKWICGLCESHKFNFGVVELTQRSGATATSGKKVKRVRTDLIAKHLRSRHGVVSDEGKQRVAMRKQGKARHAEALAATNRDLGLQTAIVVVGTNLPIAWVEKAEVRALLEFANAYDHTHPPTLGSVRLSIAELYVWRVGQIKDVLSEAKRRDSMFHLGLDLWSPRGANARKFIGLRISWVNPTRFGERRSVLLGIRRYLSLALRDGEGPEAARSSDQLLKYVNATLRDYGLTTGDVFSSCTDAGSDVKRCCSSLMGESLWTWCTAHMLSLVLGDAMRPARRGDDPSCLLTVANTINEVRDFLARRPLATEIFERITKEERGSSLKLLGYVSNRWLSLYKSLERFITLFACIQRLYDELEAAPQMPDLLKDSMGRNSVKKAMRILQPAQRLLEQVQDRHRLHDGSIHLAVIKLRSSWREQQDMHFGDHDWPLRSTVDVLVSGLHRRYFRNYEGGEGGLLQDAACWLNPAFKKLTYLDDLLADMSSTSSTVAIAEERRAAINTFIYDKALLLAERAAASAAVKPASATPKMARSASSNAAPTPPPAPAEQQAPKLDDLWGQASRRSSGPPKKKARRASAGPADRSGPTLEAVMRQLGEGDETALDPDCFELSDEEAEVGEGPPSLGAAIRAEMRSFQDGARIRRDENIAAFWQRKGDTFPNLRRLAAAVAGHEHSAAEVERDFSAAANVYTCRRQSLDQSFLSALLFLKINKVRREDIEKHGGFSKIPCLGTQREAKARFPTLHISRAEELGMAAEDAQEDNADGEDDGEVEVVVLD